MRVIGITGGPCGGKSTILRAIKKNFGKKSGVQVVNEAATALLKVFPVPYRDVPLTKEWLIGFQKAVKTLQEESLIAWCQSGAKLLVCDRGLADGPAYLGNQQEFCEVFKCQMDDLWWPYNEIIYLPSLATINPDLYWEKRGSNKCRYESSLAEAQALDQRLHDAWVGCQKRATWTYLAGTMEENARAVLQIVAENLAGEVG
jgi:hypothetical protein